MADPAIAGFGFPTGGAVAICGASAAMAISAILPPSESRDRNLSFTVITVTIMSTLATILYPVLASGLRLDPATTGLLPGSTIHDVAQVAGAGFSASSETGGIAIVLKLVRVALLAPVLMIAVVMLRRTERADQAGCRWCPASSSRSWRLHAPMRAARSRPASGKPAYL